MFDALEPAASDQSSPNERDDAYFKTVVLLAEGWRVIECKDGLQWVLQRRKAAGGHRAHWRGVSYCTSREALIRLSARVASPDALCTLRALPPSIRGSSQNRCVGGARDGA